MDASGARDSEAELSDDSSDTSEYSSDDNSDDDSDDSDDDAGERDGLDPTTAVPSDSQPDEVFSPSDLPPRFPRPLPTPA